MWHAADHMKLSGEAPMRNDCISY